MTGVGSGGERTVAVSCKHVHLLVRTVLLLIELERESLASKH